MQTQREQGCQDEAAEAAEAALSYLHPRVTSFRSRRASLTSAQQQTWARLWALLGTDFRPDPNAGLSDRGLPDPPDIRRWFGRSAPVVLEIGCGSGASTAAMAQAEPHLDVVAVEVYRRGLAQLLGVIDREGIGNIRLVRGDGADVLRHMFGPDSLTGVRVFFPDPWPKSRHHKRRLLQPSTIALIIDRLVPDGVLHVATDHPGYAEQIAAAGDAEPGLVRVDPARDQLPIDVRRPTTKYEIKAHDAGSTVVDLVWVKSPLGTPEQPPA